MSQSDDLYRIEAARIYLEQHVHNPVERQRALLCARQLQQWQIRGAPFLAAIAIPLLRRSSIPDDELKRLFGSRPLQLARAVINLLYSDVTQEHRRRSTTRRIYTEKLRRFFIAAYNDPEVVLVCIADRIATMEDIGSMSDIERLSWAEDIRRVYLPLLEMLGMWHFRRELGNYSLLIRDEASYRSYEADVQKHHEKNLQYAREISQNLHTAFKHANIHNALITLHENTPISINQRIESAPKREDRAIIASSNVLTVDILLEEERDCYYALGIVHNLWRPALRERGKDEMRFRDYIATPRFNGYRCLITTVLYPISESGKCLLEFRIRTQEMEHFNAFGVLAAIQSGKSPQNVWWKNTVGLEYIRIGTTASLSATIAVFTPMGELLFPLEQGSTVIDAAFRIHSALAPYARNFWVNGNPVDYRSELRNRDIIEIEFDPDFPSLEPVWEEYARTDTARIGIRRFIREQMREPHRGRKLIDEVLDREMNIYGMRYPKEKIDTLLTQFATQRGYHSLEALYVSIINNEAGISPDEVAAYLIDSELTQYIIQADGKPLPTRYVSLARTWMQERAHRKWDRNLRVLPGVDIVGKWNRRSKEPVLVVHRAESQYIKHDTDLVPLRWRTTSSQREVAEISLSAPINSPALGWIINNIYKIGIDNTENRIGIQSVNAGIQNGSMNIELTIDAPSKEGIMNVDNMLLTMQREGHIIKYRMWSLFPGQRIQIAKATDRRHRNPYTLRKIEDQSMFFGRQDEMNRIINLIQEGESFIVLYGQPRIGKTSLLYQLCEHFLPQACNVLPIQIDLQSVSPMKMDRIFRTLADATAQKIAEQFKRSDERRNLRLKDSELEKDPFQNFVKWVQRVEQQLQGTRLLFVIDEFTRAEGEVRNKVLEEEFFNAMQYFCDMKVGFLLCVHEHVYGTNSIGWSLYQRGIGVKLELLDHVAAAQLIQHPLEQHYKLDPRFVDTILELTNGHPYLIHGLGIELMHTMSQREDTYISLDLLNDVAYRFVTAGQNYFKHYKIFLSNEGLFILWVIANLAASDPTRAGWVTSDEVRTAIQKQAKSPLHDIKVSQRIGELRSAGLLASRESGGQAYYRITIGLVAQWVRHVNTTPITLLDLSRND